MLGFITGLFSDPNLVDWINALTAVVTAATGITALTKSKSDDKFVNLLLKVLNVLAGNVFKNKNADSV